MGRKPTDTGPDPFPAGLRVLVVDDDPTCLIILEKMLSTCKYIVTKTNRAEVALNLLRENKNGFDVVISDVHMPDMDGFKLLEHVGYEMDLPVIMMSADDSNHVVMKGVTHGACDYLIKPVRIEALRNIWQHVVRKKKDEWREVEQSSSWDDGERQHKQDAAPASSSANEGSWKGSKRKNGDEDVDEKDDTTTLKKPRVVWSVELHQQFVVAVNQLGVDKAVPKKILEIMNVSGLTRENVASHLQKYRLYLKRMTQQYGELNSAFMPQDSGFSAMSSLGGFQALHGSSQLSAQTMAAYNRLPSMNPNLSMPFVDQRNLFSFDNSKPRYGDTNQQQLSNVSKPMNLLHGIPTTLEPKQLAGLNQSAQNMDGHVSQIQSMRSNGANGFGYNPVSQAGPSGNMLGFCNGPSTGNDWPLQNPKMSFGISSQNASGMSVVPSVLVNQSYISSQKPDQNGISLNGNPMLATGLGNQLPRMQNINHNANGFLADGTSRVKAERNSDVVNSGTNVFSEHYGQQDLMCALLKQ